MYQEQIVVGDNFPLPSLIGRAAVYGPRGALGRPGSATACLPALTTNRVAANNPNSYTASTAVIGGMLEGSCDLTTTGHLAAWFFAFETPVQVPLSGGQVLLCIDQGSGELFTGGGLGPIFGPIATFELPVTSTTSMCGVTFYSQAMHFFGVTPFAFSNAQDIRLGL